MSNKRKHNPAWHDPPEARRERQAKRRQRLNEVARVAGFDTWTMLETAVMAGQAKIVKK